MCPNGAILRAGRRYRIEPLLCTECALFADEAACATACPQDAVLTRTSVIPPAIPALMSKNGKGMNSK